MTQALMPDTPVPDGTPLPHYSAPTLRWYPRRSCNMCGHGWVVFESRELRVGETMLTGERRGEKLRNPGLRRLSLKGTRWEAGIRPRRLQAEPRLPPGFSGRHRGGGWGEKEKEFISLILLLPDTPTTPAGIIGASPRPRPRQLLTSSPQPPPPPGTDVTAHYQQIASCNRPGW